MFIRFIIVAIFLGTSFAAICPPVEELAPYTCDEVKATISCVSIRGRFDIKSVFDRASPFVNESTIFEELEIRETSGLFEIPADSIPTLKFRKITFDFNENLEYISPQAFRDTHPITTELSLWNNYLHNAAPVERDIFNFFNQFTNVQSIWLPSNRITTVPDHAFTSLPHLTSLYLGSNSIETIGNFVFAELPSLENLYLSHNRLTATGLAVDAFSGAGSSVIADLEYNTKITYLEETSFKSLLNNVATAVVGGTSCGHNGCSHVYLDCDTRADWICSQAETFQPKLKGFLCSGSLYEDVWAYCNSQKL